ncbi:MAG: tRNA (5-methylaminomethyl-2-thiouridine)(34)-methyltransferase MnmD [Asticcacaulis sp.]
MNSFPDTSLPAGATDPDLVFGEDGAPRSGRFGDIYFSLQDGLAESRVVFLEGCGLPERWLGRQSFTVAELGFGTGLNILSLMTLWRATRPKGAHLSVFSVEGFPLTRDQAEQALARFPDVIEARAALLAQWPAPVPGFQTLNFPDWGLSLTLGIGPVEAVLSDWAGQADAWFLDGFAPAQNPDMWSEAVMAQVTAHTAPGGRLATFTVAGAVRRALSEQGFTVRKMPGFGRKRERLEADFPGQPARPAIGATNPVAVIGSGIAGAAIVAALREAGIEFVTVFDPLGVAGGASGNPAGLVTPRLDAGDGPVSDLYSQAFRYAVGTYGTLCPDVILHQGTRQRPSGPRDPARFAKIADQPRFADGAVRLAPDGSLDLPLALAVRPDRVVPALMGAVPVQPLTVTGFTPDEEGWRLTAEDAAGTSHTCGPFAHVFMAAAMGSAALCPLGLRPVRGQVSWQACPDAVPVPDRPEAWGGYAIPFEGQILYGATHDRDQTGTDVTDEDHRRNQATLAAVWPGLSETFSAMELDAVQGRAGVRATTRDHLPVAGPVPGRARISLLTGLGSRGLCLAPLLARAVVREALGLDSGLPRAVRSFLDPSRAAVQVSAPEMPD